MFVFKHALLADFVLMPKTFNNEFERKDEYERKLSNKFAKIPIGGSIYSK